MGFGFGSGFEKILVTHTRNVFREMVFVNMKSCRERRESSAAGGRPCGLLIRYLEVPAPVHSICSCGPYLP